MPSTARVTVMEQETEKRYVLHLLYANTINRGGEMNLSVGKRNFPNYTWASRHKTSLFG